MVKGRGAPTELHRRPDRSGRSPRGRVLFARTPWR